MEHIELGKSGENLAAIYLKNEGFEIVEQNYRYRKLEIDIICQKKDALVIVEVKTRNSSAFGEPYNAVTRKKQRQIIKAANNFIIQNRINKEVRFDIISIIMNRHGNNLEHVEGAFYPTL